MLKQKPKISVIIATADRPEELKKAVQSVIAQTFRQWELLILDASSSTKSYEAIEDLLTGAHDIRYLHMPDSSIPVGKRYNQGLQIAGGEYIAFLSDDSVYHKSSLKELFDSFQENLDFVYGRVFTRDFHSGMSLTNTYAIKEWRPREIKRTNEIHISSVLVKKSLINKIGGFNETMQRGYKLNFWNRVFNSGKTKRIYSVIADVTVGHLDSLTYLFPEDIQEDFMSKIYPLVGYWARSAKRRVSFNCPQNGIVRAINEKDGVWEAFDYDSKGIVVTDSSIGINTFQTYVHYKDPRNTKEDPFLKAIAATLSPTHNTPHPVLPPVLFERELLELEEVSFHPRELRLGCLDLTDAKAILLDSLMPELYSNFKKVTIVRHTSTPFFHKRTAQYAHLSDDSLVWDDANLLDLKKKKLSCILSLDSDYNNLEHGYRMFFLSVLLHVPLISQPNLAFDGLLENGKHYFSYTKIPQIVFALKALEILETRTHVLKEARLLARNKFFDSIVADRLTLFLNALWDKKVI